MKNSDITDPRFLLAVEAIDIGDVIQLEKLLTTHPYLLTDRLHFPDGGYFQNPYLLWFVAGNPIRVEKLPANIVEVTRLLIGKLKSLATDSYQQQLNYTLSLVITGRIPRECNVQLPLIDLLIDAGAKTGNGLGALAIGNIAAAKHLLKRGGTLTLATATGLNRIDDVKQLSATANRQELLLALTVAAFYGNATMVAYLLRAGAPVNGYPENNDGFHAHATPLHQAVSSSSMDTVKLLVEAGADLNACDKIYDGTPLGWAKNMAAEDTINQKAKKNFEAIADYLSNK